MMRRVAAVAVLALALAACRADLATVVNPAGTATVAVVAEGEFADYLREDPTVADAIGGLIANVAGDYEIVDTGAEVILASSGPLAWDVVASNSGLTGVTDISAVDGKISVTLGRPGLVASSIEGNIEVPSTVDTALDSTFVVVEVPGHQVSGDHTESPWVSRSGGVVRIQRPISTLEAEETYVISKAPKTGPWVEVAAGAAGVAAAVWLFIRWRNARRIEEL